MPTSERTFALEFCILHVVILEENIAEAHNALVPLSGHDEAETARRAPLQVCATSSSIARTRSPAGTVRIGTCGAGRPLCKRRLP